MSVSLHQRSLITCITTLSVWDELLLLNIKLVVLGSGWPLFGFSPLRICQVGGGGAFSEGMPVWAKNVENVQERRRRLDHLVQGATLVFVATDGIFSLTVNNPASGESDWNFSNRTSTKANNDQNVLLCFWKMRFFFFSPLSFIFSCTLWMTPRYISVPGRAMKESDQWLQVRCSGTESSVKRSFKVALRFPSTPHFSRDSHLTPYCNQTLPGQCNRPEQAQSCFVRLGIGSENCKLCSWKAVKKTNVFFLQRLCSFWFFFRFHFDLFLFWLAKFSYP